MGSSMSREIRFGARTLLVAILTIAMALQGYFPAVTAHADTARPGDAAAYKIEVGETVALPSLDGRTTFESSDPRVATVTEGGVVTGVGEGRATIRATIAMSGIGGRLWEWALTIIGRMLGEHDPIAQTVTREFRVVVRPKADERPADSDGDGIIDAGEASLGTDPLKPDTDGDGLSDYEELLLGTDPLTPNGYDAARDSDGDGLTDLDEAARHRTDPHARDTDFDGLSDYEEVVTHRTDPLRRDTDGDSLSDKFEVDHGLDPNSGSSDGTHRDDEVKISQTLPESAMSRQLRDESNVARPSLKGEVAGELARHVFLSESDSSTVGDNRAIVGKAVYVDGDDGHVSGLTLSFDLGGYEGDLTYLAIATLDGDGGYAPVDFERTGTTLSATLESGRGTYFVLDVREFLGSLGIRPEGAVPASATHAESLEGRDGEGANAIVAEKSEGALGEDAPTGGMGAREPTEGEVTEYGAEVDGTLLASLNDSNAALLSPDVSGQADIVFAIDTTGSMSSTINRVVTNVISFTTTLSERYNVKVNYALIDFRDLEADGPESTAVVKNGSSNWFSDAGAFALKVQALVASGGGDVPECAVDALETARQLDWRGNSSKFVILITDAGYKMANRYGIGSMDEETRLLAHDGIVTSVVTGSDCKEAYRSLYEATGGIYADISSESFSSSLLTLADLIGTKTSDGTWVILGSGYRYVKLTDSPDQDGDGLTTAYELGDTKRLDLSPWVEFLLMKAGVPAEKYVGKTSIIVYDAKSDPTRGGTDGDGIPDGKEGKMVDTAPWRKGLKDGIVGAIKICSYGDGASESPGFRGHAYLAYTSFIVTDVRLYGILVTSAEEISKGAIDDREDRPAEHTLTLESDSVTSIGSWDLYLPWWLQGSWINNEYYRFGSDGNYISGDQTSLMKYVSYEQLERMEASVRAHSRWTPLYNCSAFARDVWNDMLNDDLSAGEPWPSPRSLAYNMRQREGYEIKSPMRSEWP